jgi:Mrp family chromosome partitioning ATPase
MTDDTADHNTTDGEKNAAGGGAQPPRDSAKLVRLLKPVVVIPPGTKSIDESVISPRFYNTFNYAMIAKAQTDVNMVIGVTSASKGEGKTIVAANLAVSLATVNERDTVLVDLSVAAPVLHTIFGTNLSPGLVEALDEPMVHVSETRIHHLFVLSAGNAYGNPLTAERLGGGKTARQRFPAPSLGLEHIAEFRNIVYSLKEQYDFVIVDMPAARQPGVPVLLAHQMDGVLVVVDANRTKREDIDKMFRRFHDNHVIGFVLNRVSDDFLG